MPSHYWNNNSILHNDSQAVQIGRKYIIGSQFFCHQRRRDKFSVGGCTTSVVLLLPFQCVVMNEVMANKEYFGLPVMLRAIKTAVGKRQEFSNYGYRH